MIDFSARKKDRLLRKRVEKIIRKEVKYLAKSDSIGTISGFTRKKAVTVTTGGTSIPADYQVKLTIDYESGMNADFRDIRFNTQNGDYIDYWIESKTDLVSATVWVELPDAITDPGSDSIWMYWGSNGLSDDSNGSDTFLQYHGAASSDFLDSLNINSLNEYIWEGRIKSKTATHELYWGLANNIDCRTDDQSALISYSGLNNRYTQVRNESAATNKNENPSLTLNQWYNGKLIFDGSTLTGYIDGDEIGTGGISSGLPNENLGLVKTQVTGTSEQDWSFVRKHIANEPTPTYGTAQKNVITRKIKKHRKEDEKRLKLVPKGSPRRLY